MRKSLLLFLVFMLSLLMCSCTKSAESLMTSAEEHIQNGEMTLAEEKLLTALEKEPENTEIKSSLGAVYRKQAMEADNVESKLEKLNQAANYIADIEYTIEELENLATCAIGEKGKAKVVWKWFGDVPGKRPEAIINQELYIELLKAAVSESDDTEEKNSIIDEWLKKDTGNTEAMCLKAINQLGLGSMDFSEITEFGDAQRRSGEYTDAYAVDMYAFVNSPMEATWYNSYVVNEKNQLLYTYTLTEQFDIGIFNEYFRGIKLSYDNDKLNSVECLGAASYQSKNYNLIYDDEGRFVKTVTDKKNTTVEHRYDELDRIVYSSGFGYDYKFTYDEKFVYKKGKYRDINEEVPVDEKQTNTTQFQNQNLYFNQNILDVKNGESIIADRTYENIRFDNGNIIKLINPVSKGETISISYEKTGEAREDAICDYNAGMQYKICVNDYVDYEISYDAFGLMKSYKLIRGSEVGLFYIHSIVAADNNVIYQIPVIVTKTGDSYGMEYKVEYMPGLYRRSFAISPTLELLYYGDGITYRESPTLEVVHLK